MTLASTFKRAPSTPHPPAVSPGSFWRAVWRGIRRHRARRALARQVAHLDERMLRDIGLHPGTLPPRCAPIDLQLMQAALAR